MLTEPLCAKCGVRFKPKKINIEISINDNGNIVSSFTDIPQTIQKGELYECPICKHVIITNFGEPYQKKR